VAGGWGNARRPDREHLPFTDEVAERHLAGQIHAGLYPLLRGDTCRLLVCDFDPTKATLSINRGLVAIGYDVHETRGKTRNARRRIISTEAPSTCSDLPAARDPVEDRKKPRKKTV
jgi:hypothetical protein